MTKLVRKSVFVSIIALLLLLVVGTVAAGGGAAGGGGLTPPDPDVPDAPAEPVVIIGPVYDGASLTGPGDDPRQPVGTSFKLNFEVGGGAAQRGLYVVKDLDGNEVESWYAIDGWTDSGWFHNVDIAGKYVQVKVLYYSGPGAKPITMKVLNPAPGTSYGWIAKDIGHAIEIAFP